MGSSRSQQVTRTPRCGDPYLPRLPLSLAMAPKTSVMSKGALTGSIAEACEIKKADAKKMLETLASIATAEVKKNAKFVIPGLVMLKTRKKPATKAGKREIFGKMVMVKAKPAKTVVKAFPAKVLKNEF